MSALGQKRSFSRSPLDWSYSIAEGIGAQRTGPRARAWPGSRGPGRAGRAIPCAASRKLLCALLRGRAVHHAQKMFSVLPVLLARHGVVAVGRLCQIAVMIVFLLQLALIVGRGLLAALGTPRIAGEIGPRTVAAIGVGLGWHFEHFMSLRAQSTFDHVAAAEECGPFGQKPNGLPLGGQEFNWPSLYGHSAV